VTSCRQWVAVPFAANHGAMAGRNIFTGVQELSTLSVNASGSTSTTPSAAATELVTTVNGSSAAPDFEISWLGTFDPADTGLWIDSALLLVFGGIPWQVGSARDLVP